MAIATAELNGTLVLTPYDSIPPAEAAPFEVSIRRALEAYRWIVVDLTHVKSMCSSAMGCVYHAKRQVSEAGGDVKLCCASDYDASMFDLMFAGIFQRFPTRDEAVAAFRAPG